uniref:SecY-independent transporter protein n=1 Tax=Isoetes engelmannii TaxID=37427 RepID=C6FG17_ISOEN|nr:SecY-independent transporter protein [Isoetes engelmannii]ACI95889.1 SecY-independent transporter protein [Isoetes engelmannii]
MRSLNFVLETTQEEFTICFFRILIRLSLTRFTRHWFPEEPISLLAKPSPTSPHYLDPYSSLIRTGSTEALSTYVTMSLIPCLHPLFPSSSHQIWCFLILSCSEKGRKRYNELFYLSGSRSSPFLPVTSSWAAPNVRHSPYPLSTTLTNPPTIRLQPKISNHIMLTVRIPFLPPICSQVSVIVICLLEPRGLSAVETPIKNRRFQMVFPLFTPAFPAPPDIWCQIVALFSLYFPIELTIFVALIKFSCKLTR